MKKRLFEPTNLKRVKKTFKARLGEQRERKYPELSEHAFAQELSIQMGEAHDNNLLSVSPKKETIRSWFQDSGSTPQNIEQLIILAEALDCDVDYLLGRYNSPHAAEVSAADYLGLDENAVNVLRNLDHKQKQALSVLLLSIKGDGNDFSDILTEVFASMKHSSIMDCHVEQFQKLAGFKDGSGRLFDGRTVLRADTTTHYEIPKGFFEIVEHTSNVNPYIEDFDYEGAANAFSNADALLKIHPISIYNASRKLSNLIEREEVSKPVKMPKWMEERKDEIINEHIENLEKNKVN